MLRIFIKGSPKSRLDSVGLLCVIRTRKKTKRPAGRDHRAPVNFFVEVVLVEKSVQEIWECRTVKVLIGSGRRIDEFQLILLVRHLHSS